MIHTLPFLVALSTCLFAGAAIYINLVQHPARMGCDTVTAVTVWAPSYKRATVMQASLAIVGFLTGVAVWLLGGALAWLVGALLIGAVIPLTFIVICPRTTNCSRRAAIFPRLKRVACWRSGANSMAYGARSVFLRRLFMLHCCLAPDASLRRTAFGSRSTLMRALL